MLMYIAVHCCSRSKLHCLSYKPNSSTCCTIQSVHSSTPSIIIHHTIITTPSYTTPPPPLSYKGLLELFYGVYEKDPDRCLDALVDMGVLVPSADRQAVRRTAEFFLTSFQDRLKAQKEVCGGAREGGVVGCVAWCGVWCGRG